MSGSLSLLLVAWTLYESIPSETVDDLLPRATLCLPSMFNFFLFFSLSFFLPFGAASCSFSSSRCDLTFPLLALARLVRVFHPDAFVLLPKQPASSSALQHTEEAVDCTVPGLLRDPTLGILSLGLMSSSFTSQAFDKGLLIFFFSWFLEVLLFRHLYPSCSLILIHFGAFDYARQPVCPAHLAATVATISPEHHQHLFQSLFHFSWNDTLLLFLLFFPHELFHFWHNPFHFVPKPAVLIWQSFLP